MPGSSPGAGGSGPPGDAPRWTQPVLDTPLGTLSLSRAGWAMGNIWDRGQRPAGTEKRTGGQGDPQRSPGAKPHTRELLLRECQNSFNTSSLGKQSCSTWASNSLYSPPLQAPVLINHDKMIYYVYKTSKDGL